MTTATATKKAPRSQSNAAAAKAATKIVPRPEAKPTPAERASRAAKRIADEILASSTPQQAFEDAAVAVLTGKSSRKPHASRPLAVQVEQGPETRTRVENLAVAKIENAALRSWKEAGAKGERPATPTIDWMSSTPAAERKAPKVASTRTGGGAQQKMSDADVKAWVLAQRKAEQPSTLATFRAAGLSCAAARFAEIRKAALS